MQVFLDGAPWYKRWFWTIASKGLIPGIFGAAGFAYIGIPSDVQAQVRRLLPYSARAAMLHQWPMNRWLFTFLLLSTICALWGGLGLGATVHFVTEKYKKLYANYLVLKSENESKTIDCFKLFSNYLYGLSKSLKLGTDARISLYKFDLERFSCIGRFSENSVYTTKSGRLYPARQGCIAKAWEVGTITEGTSPDPETDWQKYVEYHVKKYAFTEDELKTLRMRSRSFYGVRLQNQQQQTVGVLMLESTDPSGLPFSKISKFVTEAEKRHLSSLIEALESHMPSLERANAEGF